MPPKLVHLDPCQSYICQFCASHLWKDDLQASGHCYPSSRMGSCRIAQTRRRAGSGKCLGPGGCVSSPWQSCRQPELLHTLNETSCVAPCDLIRYSWRCLYSSEVISTAAISVNHEIWKVGSTVIVRTYEEPFPGDQDLQIDCPRH